MLWEWQCTWHFSYLLILIKRFPTKLFQDILFNDSKYSLGQEKGCSSATGLCCSVKVQVHSREFTCNCIELWKINFSVIFARCPQSEHPPVCDQKWYVCIQGIKLLILLVVIFWEIVVRNSNRMFVCVIISVLTGLYVPHIEAGTDVCSVFALSRLSFSLECVLTLFCVNFTSECQSVTLSRDRLYCRITVISCKQTLHSLHFFIPSLREGVCCQRWWLFQQFEFSWRLPTVLLFGCCRPIQNLK